MLNGGKGIFTRVVVLGVLIVTLLGMTSCETSQPNPTSNHRNAYETHKPYPIVDISMEYNKNMDGEGQLKFNEDGSGYFTYLNQDSLPFFVNFTYEKLNNYQVNLVFEDVDIKTYFVIGPQNPYEATINYKYPPDYFEREEYYTAVDTVDITQGVNGAQYHVLWKYERNISDYSGVYTYGDDDKRASVSYMSDVANLGTAIRMDATL